MAGLERTRGSAGTGLASCVPDELAERLDTQPSVDGAEVVGWRFDFGTGWSLEAGLKDGQLGGPYEPPAASRGSGGSLYLRWSDGSCSYGTLDAYTLADWDERLAEWRAAAYHDSDEPDILPPPDGPLPRVRMSDPSVEALLDGDPAPMIVLLDRARTHLGRHDLHRVHADNTVRQARRFVYSSRGLRVDYLESAASFSLAAEQRYWRTYSKRRWPTAAELDELLADVAETTLRLRSEAVGPVGEVPVLLRPTLARKMIGAFVLANLNGASVVNDQAAFKLQDFLAGRQILRDDFDLIVDTLRDLEPAASPISSEGVPGGRDMLVERGRLRRPVVGLKYAGRTGFPPTPLPAATSGYLLRSPQPPRPVAEARAGLSLGLEVASVLGLSGQDSASGRYSLVAAQALVIQGGRALGRAKVALAGSFFDHLLDERTELIDYPHGIYPGLLIWTKVERQA